MKIKSLMLALCLIAGSQLAVAQVKVAELVKEWEGQKLIQRNTLMP